MLASPRITAKSVRRRWWSHRWLQYVRSVSALRKSRRAVCVLSVQSRRSTCFAEDPPAASRRSKITRLQRQLPLSRPIGTVADALFAIRVSARSAQCVMEEEQNNHFPTCRISPLILLLAPILLCAICPPPHHTSSSYKSLTHLTTISTNFNSICGVSSTLFQKERR